jgi:hypothetical protein
MRDASSGDKLKIALFGELSLEEAMDLSRDRQMLELQAERTAWEARSSNLELGNHLSICL